MCLCWTIELIWPFESGVQLQDFTKQCIGETNPGRHSTCKLEFRIAEVRGTALTLEGQNCLAECNQNSFTSKSGYTLVEIRSAFFIVYFLNVRVSEYGPKSTTTLKWHSNILRITIFIPSLKNQGYKSMYEHWLGTVHWKKGQMWVSQNLWSQSWSSCDRPFLKVFVNPKNKLLLYDFFWSVKIFSNIVK